MQATCDDGECGSKNVAHTLWLWGQARNTIFVHKSQAQQDRRRHFFCSILGNKVMRVEHAICVLAWAKSSWEGKNVPDMKRVWQFTKVMKIMLGGVQRPKQFGQIAAAGLGYEMVAF